MKIAAVFAGLCALIACAGGRAATPTIGGRIAFAIDVNGISRLYSVRPDGKRLRRLTLPPTRQLLGGDSGPVWSPDGRRIAFERDLPSWGQDRYQLYVTKSRGGGHDHALTSGPYDVMPAWAPDGTRIAFSRVAISDDSATSSIATVDPASGAETAITSGALDLSPAWSPDGRQIVFSRLVAGAPALETAELYVASADGHEVRPLSVRGISPSWSPDGSRIAFVSFADRNGRSCTAGDCAPNGELYTVAPSGQGLTRLTQTRSDDEHPTWSPDGGTIAFASGFATGHGHSPWLMRMPAGGGKATPVLRRGWVLDPAWSPR